MSYKIIFGIIAAILPFIAYSPYLRDTIRMKIRPDPISWLIWTIVSLSVSWVMFRNQAGIGAVSSLAIGFLCLLIYLFSFRDNRHRGVAHVDVVILLLAFAAIALWGLTDQAWLAAALLALADFMGTVATLYRDWKHPDHDDMSIWLIQSFTRIFTLISLSVFSFTTAISPLVGLISDILVVFVLLDRRHWEKIRKQNEPSLREFVRGKLIEWISRKLDSDDFSRKVRRSR